MGNGFSALERAFQIARSGSVRNIQELREALRRERYDSKSIEGPSLSKQLRELIKTAVTKAPAEAQNSAHDEELNASRPE